MADKSKMKCNVVKASDRAGKKKMEKACEGGKCSSATNKLSARYWACKKLWAGKGGSTKSSPQSRQGKY